MNVFLCRPLRTKLTRASCAARSLRAVRGTRSHGSNGRKLLADECVKCPVGAAHRRGAFPQRWPDGHLIQISNLKPRSAS